MRLPRRDNILNDAIEALDEKYTRAQSKAKTDIEIIPIAWSLLDRDEIKFIDQEVGKSLDRRYFMENYYVIRDEAGRMRTLYPFWSHQELIIEAVEEEWEDKGCVRLIVLKPRQAGSTTWNAALIYHGTTFFPNSYSLVMAQRSDVSLEIYTRMMDAHAHVPWWMRAETSSKQQGLRVLFQRSDDERRNVDPGLGSTLLVSDAQKSAGIAIGRTIRNLLGSEVSRWPDAQVWTSDIKPSLNAPDMLGILESTAFGRNGLYWNMWNAAEKGKSVWRALFIPVYKVTKYYLPVYKKENFTLTPEEKKIRRAVSEREQFKIPIGFFKWRRQDIIETINSTGSDETHKEAYPITSKEAFLSSGDCAFPKKELDRQSRENVRDPRWVGEIEYVSMDDAPVLHLHVPTDDEIADKPDKFNRFWVWEEPVADAEYYLASDVASGEARDFSDAAIYRLGWGSEPDVQVAEWHGKMNASHYARVLAAIGHWYNDCEIAVEYTQSGITTGDELRWVIDYPNLYRWKRLDVITNVNTQHIHWVTNQRTRDDAINRLCEALLDHSIVIRNHHAIEEMRDFARYEGEGKAQGIDNNDDMCLAHLICKGASHQSNKRQEMTESRAMGTGQSSSLAASLMPRVPVVFNIYDQYGRTIQQVDSVEAGKRVIAECEKKYKLRLADIWRIVPVTVMKANTPFSTAYDDPNSAQGQLLAGGLEPRHQTLEIIQIYRDMLNHQHHTGVIMDGDD